MKLTKAQKRALTVARDHGNAFAKIGIRSRAGGAYGRMCKHLAAAGLLTTERPYRITEAGLAALAESKP